MACSHPRRADGDRGERPDSRQPCEYLLCSGCEQHLSNWERYVEQIAFKMDGTCPLYELLGHSSAVSSLPSKIPPRLVEAGGLDIDVVKRFGVSVFWRYSVSSYEPTYTLGPYEEPLRRYLFEAAEFPEDTCVVAFGVLDQQPLEGGPHRTIISPTARKKDGKYRQHVFGLAGLYFHMAVGKRIDPSHRREAIDNGIVILAPANQFTLFKEAHHEVRRARGLVE